MPRSGMNGLIGRALAMLFMVAFAGIAVLWSFASEHPVLAAFVIPFIVWRVVVAERKEQRLKREALDARLRDEHVPSMSPREYEQFAARQLERAGWKVLHCGHSGDQGCDVLAELRGFRAVVQCKLYRARCGNAAVQQVVGSRRFYDAHIMAVVCPAGYTAAAQALAASNGVHLLHHTALAGLERAARIPCDSSTPAPPVKRRSTWSRRHG